MTQIAKKAMTVPQGLNEICLVVDNESTSPSEKASYMALQQSVIGGLKETEANLEKKVKILSNKVISTRQEADSYKKDVQRLLAEVESLSNKPTEYAVDQSIVDQLEELQNKFSELDVEKDLADAEIESLKNQNIAKQAKINRSLDNESLANAKLQRSESEADKLANENKALAEECTESALEVIKLSGEIKYLTKSNKTMRTELDGESKRRENFLAVELAKQKPIEISNSKEIEALRSEIENLTVNNKKHQASLLESNNKLTKAEGELKRSTSLIDTLTARPTELAEQAKLLSESLIEMTSKYNALKAESTDLHTNLVVANTDVIFYQNEYQSEKFEVSRLANLLGTLDKSVHLTLKEGVVYYLSNNTDQMDDDPGALYPLYLLVNRVEGENIIIYSLNDEIQTLCGSVIKFDSEIEENEVKRFITKFTNQFIKERHQLGLRAALCFGEASYETVTDAMKSKVMDSAERISTFNREPNWAEEPSNIARLKLKGLISIYAREIALLHGDKNKGLAKMRDSLLSQFKREVLSDTRAVERILGRVSNKSVNPKQKKKRK